MKKLISILLVAMLIISMFPATVSAEEAAATMSFASTAQRTSYSTTQQVWENEGITLTNNKGSSTSNVGNYTNPARFYAKSTVIIEYPQMTKVVIATSGSKYALVGATYSAGVTASTSGTTVTLTLSSPADSITITIKDQARFNSLTVYAAAAACDHAQDKLTLKTAQQDPTCTEVGYEAIYTCSCGEEVGGAEISATNHANKTLETEAVAGDCENEGTAATYYCPDCKQTLGGESTGLGKHNYVNGKCTVCDAELQGHAQVSTIAEVTAGGQFVIVAEYNGKYYALNQNVANTVYVTEVEVSDGVVVSSDAPLWTIEGTGDNTIALNDGSDYATINSSNNFTATDAAYDWVLTEENGEFRITASTNDARGLAFSWNNGTNPRFKTYSTNNLNGTGYVWYLQLYKVAVEEPKAVVAEGGAGYDTVEEALADGATTLKYTSGADMDFEVTLDDGTRYIGLKGEEFYTYYALTLKMSSISLRGSEAGIYYGAKVVCDDALASAVDSYGIVLSTSAMPTDLTTEGNAYTVIQGNVPTDTTILSGSVFNIFEEGLEDSANTSRGEVPIYAAVYLNIDGQVVISKQEISWSLEKVVETIDTAMASGKLTLGDEQKAALADFYKKWAVDNEVINSWSVSNIASLYTASLA